MICLRRLLLHGTAALLGGYLPVRRKNARAWVCRLVLGLVRTRLPYNPCQQLKRASTVAAGQMCW